MRKHASALGLLSTKLCRAPPRSRAQLSRFKDCNITPTLQTQLAQEEQPHVGQYSGYRLHGGQPAVGAACASESLEAWRRRSMPAATTLATYRCAAVLNARSICCCSVGHRPVLVFSNRVVVVVNLSTSPRCRLAHCNRNQHTWRLAETAA
eukprot:scaffold240_cov77-Phaeocystis_antarctica.AAC.4